MSSFGNGNLILNEATKEENNSIQTNQPQPDDEYEAMKNIFDQNMSFEIQGKPTQPAVSETTWNHQQQQQEQFQYTHEKLREYEFQVMQ